MAIFLIRHTAPLSPEGICYGQTDLPVGPTFAEEAEKIRKLCPDPVEKVYSSSLGRCLTLARYLWPQEHIHVSDALREMDFGAWENKPWAQIDAQTWMNDFVHAVVPGGESYQMLMERCVAWWARTIVRGAPPQTEDTVILTHAGVIRSLLCHCTGTPLLDSFRVFPVPFGAVYRLYQEKGSWESRLL